MALAEARAAWQRTANRCLVQEDAKRAPKLACCGSSLPPSVKQSANTEPSNSTCCNQDSNASRPFSSTRNPSFSNLSPNSKWWLQLQHQQNHGCQKGLMDEQYNSLESNMETCQEGNQCENLAKKDCAFVEENHFKCEVKGKICFDREIYFDLESSWVVGGGKGNSPWWRTADKEELALLVAQRSLDHVENCDLPRPQNTFVNKELDVKNSCFGHDRISAPFIDSEHDVGHIHRSACKPLRGNPACKVMPETIEDDTSKAQLLEALRHSQTRAREAEKAAKQARAEKDHIAHIVFGQASQLFAYKQWLQLLQLENLSLQFKNNSKSRTASIVFPIMLPWTPQRNRKMRRHWQKFYSRRRAKRSFHQYSGSNYSVVLAFGLGLVGAGLLLGWTIGWMIPVW